MNILTKHFFTPSVINIVAQQTLPTVSMLVSHLSPYLRVVYIKPPGVTVTVWSVCVCVCVCVSLCHCEVDLSHNKTREVGGCGGGGSIDCAVC